MEKEIENGYNLKRLALILAVQAEIEGMKAQNAANVQYDKSLPYQDDQFKEKAEQLRQLAYAHNEQL